MAALVTLGVERADIAAPDHASGDMTLTLWVAGALVALAADTGYVHDSEVIDGSIALRYLVLPEAEPPLTAPPQP